MKLKTIIRVLFTPTCWLRNSPASSELSKFINERMDAGDNPEWVSLYIFSLSGVEFWGANYPYAFGTLREEGRWMPDRETVFRLYDALPNGPYGPDDPATKILRAARERLGSNEESP